MGVAGTTFGLANFVLMLASSGEERFHQSALWATVGLVLGLAGFLLISSDKQQ